MRTLSSTLLAAQKASSRRPYVKVEARNNLAGVVNLKWERLYTGAELDSVHAITIPGNGSLVRIRATPTGDNGKLYRQRVASPGAGSDFSQWTYLNLYGIVAVAACSLGAEVSLFWAKNDGEISYQKSLDYGVTWQGVAYLGYAPSGAVTGMAAAYKTNGDLILFFTHLWTLYMFKRVSGTWQSRTAWNKTAHNLGGVAAFYVGDWKLLISGQTESGDYKVWSLIYGDGDEVTAGSWSALKEITSAPYGGNFEYTGVFLDVPDAAEGFYRCFFVEKFSGSQAYSRPFWSHTLPDTAFLENRWREPVPFNLESLYGLAMAHTASYVWLAAPWGIWRASLAESSLDLSADVLSLTSTSLPPDASGGINGGALAVELRNDNGQYSSLGEGVIEVLDHGCQVDFSPGYVTPEGNEVSVGQSFTLQAYEHTSSPGRASLILLASDGWEALEKWIARYQLRWNKPDQYGAPVQEAAVKEILAYILARVGLRLVISSQSSTITGFYPDFTVHAGDNGRAVVTRLLSFVPDVLFMEGSIAYLVNPLGTDSSVYSYGSVHAILEGRYRQDAWKFNRVQVEGLNPVGPAPVSAESFDWPEIQKSGDRLEMLEDLNVSSVALAQGRGAAYLRQAEIESATGFIRVPVNCGQQLYDVIDITDPRAGLSAAPRRVLGISLSYHPKKGEYEQVLKLGAV